MTPIEEEPPQSNLIPMIPSACLDVEIVPSPAPSWDVGRECLIFEFVPSLADLSWDVGRECSIL